MNTEIGQLVKLIDEVREFLLSLETVQAASIKEFTIPERWKELLNSPAWPPAVPESLICDAASDDDKYARAEGIIASLLQLKKLKSRKFLDFGCGEGHVVKKAFSENVSAIGYDVEVSGNLEWEDGDPLLTTDFSKVVENGPYDIVLIYDVLDHTRSPIEALKLVKSVCNAETEIILRCHPWCGRHGGHLYQNTNKAFLHLFVENGNFAQKVTHPLYTYGKWIKAAGFTVASRITHTTKVENFFQENQLIQKHIQNHWKSSHDQDLATGRKFPNVQMEQDFLDFNLKVTET